MVQHGQPEPVPAALRPTRVRYLVVGACTASAILLYLHRFCFTFVQTYVQEDLGLSDDQLGLLLSAFFWTYALAQVPAGWLSDRYGARVVLTGYILFWSLFAGLIGAATGFATFLVFRLASGLGQAGAYPTCAAVVSRWVPFSARGAASSLVAGGGRIGAIIAPVLTAYLVLSFVPEETSSLLVPEDLLHPYRLSYRVLHGDPEKTPGGKESAHDRARRDRLQAIGRRIVDRLPRDAADALDAIGNGNLAEDEALQQSVHATRPAAEAVVRLTSGLNTVLGQRDFYDADLFGGVEPEREAQRLLSRLGELSQPEVYRFNRLLLEAVYKGDIRHLYGRGWRPVMIVYGALGMLVAVLFWLVHRNQPQEHRWCNAEEAALIAHARPPGAAASGKAGRLPVGAILRNVSLWMMSLSMFGTSAGWIFILTWMPRYLRDVQNAPYELRSWMATVIVAVGWVGMLLGGKLTDAMVRWVGLRWARALPIAGTRFIAAAAYLAFLFGPSQWTAVFLFALVAFATDMGNPSSWAFKQDVGGRHVGSILGWGNMWGNFGSALSPFVISGFVNQQHWDQAFMVLAAAFIFSGLCALGIDASRPVVPPDSERD